MMNPEFNDHPPLMSEYYPVGVISHFVTEQGATAEKVKTRRRRRKGKGGGEGEGGSMRKRKLSEEQLSMLEKSFGNEHKLETERKDQLAAELGLDPRQVAVWFQNRRARWKTKKLEEEFSKLRSHHESTVLEKCRLQTEVLKMKEQLEEAEKEIQRLSEEQVRSNGSPSSSLSTEANNMEPPQFGGHGFGMEYLDNVFYVPETNYAHAYGPWDDHVYYM